MVRKVLCAMVVGVLAAAGLGTPAFAAEVIPPAPERGHVAGSFTDAAGAPIAAAKVTATSIDYNHWYQTGQTDAQGRYRLREVPVGPVIVKFESPAGGVQWARGALTAEAATRFTVIAGLTTTVDEQRLPTGTIAGRFTTADGEPVNRGRVEVWSADGRNLRSVYTDADGRYSVAEVPAGSVRLKFRDDFTQWAHDAADADSATTFTVSPGQTLVVDETVLPTGTIAGQLTDSAGAPVPFFGAYAKRVGGEESVTGQVGTDGRYSIAVPAGQWRVWFVRGAAQWAGGKGSEDEGAIFTVAAGASVTVNEQLLPRGSVSGTLRGPGVSTREWWTTLWRGDDQVAWQYTDEEGGYAFEDILPGDDYRISYTWNSTEFWVPGTVHRAQATAFAVRAGQNTVVNDNPPALTTVSGTLTLPTGEPVPGMVAELTVPGTSVRREATTGADGTWKISGVFPEDYRLTIRNEAGTVRQDAGAVHVPATGTTVDTVWRGGGATLTVTGTDAAGGAPVEGFCVTVAEQFGDHCTETSTVVVAGLPAGARTIAVTPGSSSDYLPTRAAVTLTEGGTTAVTVPLTLGGRLNALIVDRATGQPVDRACVSLAVPGEGGITTPRRDCTNKQGKLTTWAYPAGTVQVFVDNASGYGAQWVGAEGGTGDQREATRFRIKAGKTTKAGTILLDKPGTVTGVVRDPAGQPAPGVDVDVTAWDVQNNPRYPSISTDAQGRYTIRTLGPYRWPLLFTPAGALPRQWSGGVGNRYQAETAAVQAGATTTYDTTLAAGSTLAGSVTVEPGGPAYVGGRLTAVNAATGDQLGVADIAGSTGTYSLPVIGGHPVKIRWYLATREVRASGWWQDAADIGTATKVNVPRTGTKRLDLTIG